MFLHLGEDSSISTSELIAIMDYEKALNSKTSRQFIESARLRKRVIHIGSENEQPKSFVITEGTIFFSPISSSTLRKRMETVARDNRLLT